MIGKITGNPNEHHRQDPVLPASKERNRFRSVVWDEYDSLHQKYLEIGKNYTFHSQFESITNHTLFISSIFFFFSCSLYSLTSVTDLQ